jgi:hypothetical protein
MQMPKKRASSGTVTRESFSSLAVERTGSGFPSSLSLSSRKTASQSSLESIAFNLHRPGNGFQPFQASAGRCRLEAMRDDASLVTRPS